MTYQNINIIINILIHVILRDLISCEVFAVDSSELFEKYGACYTYLTSYTHNCLYNLLCRRMLSVAARSEEHERGFLESASTRFCSFFKPISEDLKRFPPTVATGKTFAVHEILWCQLSEVISRERNSYFSTMS